MMEKVADYLVFLNKKLTIFYMLIIDKKRNKGYNINMNEEGLL